MDIFSALFTGIAVSVNPAHATTDMQNTQVAAVEVIPNYDTTALTETDVGFYLTIMRRAAAGAAPMGQMGDYDETVAERQGARKRYDAIKVVVEAELGGTPTARISAATLDADQKVLAPHADEIQALQKQVRDRNSGK